MNSNRANLLLTSRAVFAGDIVEVSAWGQQWVQYLGRQPGISQAWVAQVDGKGALHWISNHPIEILYPPFPDDLLQQAIGDGMIHVFHSPQEGCVRGLFPLEFQGRVIGLIGLLGKGIDRFKPDLIESVVTLSDIMARELFRDDRRNRERQAEFSINRLLQSSLDARHIMSPILEILSDALRADSILVLSHNPPDRNFEIFAAHGWKGELPPFLEPGSDGEFFLRKKSVAWIEDMQQPHSDQQPIRRMDDAAGFRGYLALPLIGHNKPSGILEIFWLAPREKHSAELEFLERIAEQIAFAMERSTVWKDIRLKTQSLTLGYDALIEGLSRTLELRDFETEGHTRRVSHMTMRLLKHMHYPSEEWEIIQRGALLHDIGKLGIPDAILLKPGSLSTDERRMMELHVIYGHNILTPIINSRQILDIVLHHHERWDGTGYPYGLKEEHIPLVARLFAVVDVFDALTADRPYRTAWSHAQAIDYITEQAGKQFDPQIVGYFLEIAKDLSGV